MTDTLNSEINVISSTVAATGEANFHLPIASLAVESVQAIDLDLMITSTDGAKFLLPHGALQAATNPESKLFFKGGDTQTAAEQLKKVGLMKPVEGGSFRLASALTPEAPEKVNGKEFGLGQDAQDVNQKIEKILIDLQKSTQAGQMNEAPTFVESITKNSAIKIAQDPLASPAPGAPPKSSDIVSSVLVSNTARSFTGSSDARFDGVLVKAVGDIEYKGPNYKALQQVELSQVDVQKAIRLDMNTKNSLVVESNGIAQATLTLPGVVNASSLILSTTDTLPDGFTIAGQSFVNGKLIISNLQSLVDLKLPVTWSIGVDNNITFAVSVKFMNGSTELGGGNAPLNFVYSDSLPVEKLDENSNLKIYLSKSGYSYEISGTSTDDTVSGGSSDDIFHSSEGADTIDGGGGTNTVSYNASASGVTIQLNSGSSQGMDGQAQGDTLLNIQKLIGSEHADQFTFSDTNPNNYTVDGGTGADSLNYSAVTTALSIDVGNATDHANMVKGTMSNSYGTTTFSHIEKVIAGRGDDNFNLAVSGVTNYSFDGGTGVDSFIYSASDNTNYTLDGGAGTDKLDYAKANSNLAVSLSSTGTSTVNGTNYGTTTFSNIEQITTGAGNDSFIYSASDTANYTLNGGAGADNLDYAKSASALTVALSSTGVGTVNGANYGTTTFSNIEKITAGAGNDSFNFAVSDITNYTLDGGAGTDKLNYANVNIKLSVNLSSSGTSTVSGVGYGTTTFSKIEQINTGAGSDSFTFAASDMSNYNVDSGMGADSLNYASVSTALTIGIDNSLGMTSTVKGTLSNSYGTTTFSHIEKIISGSGNDNITVASADTGTYTIEGSNGNDLFNGGAQRSTLSYASASSAVQLNLSNTHGSTNGGAGSDSFLNFKKFQGSNFADVFTIEKGDTTTNYTLNGGGGNDNFVVGNGLNTSINGGSMLANSSISYAQADKKVTVNIQAAGAGSSSGEDSGSVTFTNIKTFVGGAGGLEVAAQVSDTTSYTFVSGSSTDKFTGGGGNDTVIVDQSGLNMSQDIDGGVGTNTLVIFKAASTAAIDLAHLYAKDFSVLDLANDTKSNMIELSSQGIQNLVGAGNSSVLTLRLNEVDTYTIAEEAGVTVTQGKNLTFYSDVNMTQKIAQVVFSYV